MGLARHQPREVMGRDHLVHDDGLLGGKMIIIIIIMDIHTNIIIAIIIMHSSVM